MGIPRLTSHIQPYLTPTVLGCSTPDCEEHCTPQRKPVSLIIDGPGLAYYLYYGLLAHKSYHFSGLDDLPSYDELGRATVVLLDEMQKHRIEVYDYGRCIVKVYS